MVREIRELQMEGKGCEVILITSYDPDQPVENLIMKKYRVVYGEFLLVSHRLRQALADNLIWLV